MKDFIIGEFDHERLTVFSDPETGARGVIAIHSTALGPAMGGLRLFPYLDLSSAMLDALRLARAMSLKNSAAGLDLGGGKAVLIDDGHWVERREERMRSVGEAIESMAGAYITAEDVGTSPHDMDTIATMTSYVAGRSADQGGNGDPSPFTARTVFSSVQAAVRTHLGADSLSGIRVGVQGVGHVGEALVGLLRADGAEVSVTDIDPRRAQRVAEANGASAEDPEDFLTGDFEVFAPCAMGGVIHAVDVERFRATIVCGAANNPLANNGVAVALGERGILYMPDFIANSGGIIHVGAEALQMSRADSEELLDSADRRGEAILHEAEAVGSLPVEVAERFALDRMATGARLGSF